MNEVSKATLTRIKAEISEIRAHISTLEPDSTAHKIAVTALQAKWAEYSRVSSQIPPEIPQLAPRDKNVPIKSAMRAISNLGKREAVETWDWDKLTARQAAEVEKIQHQIRGLFFIPAERHIIKLILLSGGLKASLEKAKLGALEGIPDFVRKSQGKVLMKTFVEALMK